MIIVGTITTACQEGCSGAESRRGSVRRCRDEIYIEGAAEQIKRFGGVNARAVVGVGWCTWSPSVLSVTPFQ
jgi:hypothetical protein